MSPASGDVQSEAPEESVETPVSIQLMSPASGDSVATNQVWLKLKSFPFN